MLFRTLGKGDVKWYSSTRNQHLLGHMHKLARALWECRLEGNQFSGSFILFHKIDALESSLHYHRSFPFSHSQFPCFHFIKKTPLSTYSDSYSGLLPWEVKTSEPQTRGQRERSWQSSLWVLGLPPTAGSAGATAPSLALPTHGQTPANHCSCLSQVRNLFLAHAFLFLFSRYVLSNSLRPFDCIRTDPSVLHYLLLIDHSVVVVKGPLYLREAMSQSFMATQDRWVIVKSPGKTWSPGGGNGNPFQYSCLNNP